MSETQGLLDRIAALRREPEFPPSMAPARTSPASGAGGERSPAMQKVAGGYRHDLALEKTVREVAGTGRTVPETVSTPVPITPRLRELVDRGRALLGDLRRLAAEPLMQRDGHPLAVRYGEAAAMADVALRLMQSLPETTSAQLHLAHGLDGILHAVDGRVTELLTVLARHHHEREALTALAGMLQRLHDQQPVEFDSFVVLAEQLLEEARSGVRLRFLSQDEDSVAERVAAHSLTVAQVAARLTVRHEELRGCALDFVLAALTHDAGMVGVGEKTLTQREPLDGAARRWIQTHAERGGELVHRFLAGAPAWLAEVAGTHHERMDGSGYPAGLRGEQIPLPSRFLAVCDTYAALASSRPYRPAHDPRRALMLTLAAAEHGALDPHYAVALLALGYYPAGTVVELTDGSLGVSVTTPQSTRLSGLARPAVALLLDPMGQPVSGTHVLDLGFVESQAVVRALPAAERAERLGPWFVEWAL